MSCGVGHRHGSDLALLWLWCKPAAVAPIRPLAWEIPYAVGVALNTHTYTHTHTHSFTKTKVQNLSEHQNIDMLSNYCPFLRVTENVTPSKAFFVYLFAFLITASVF